jgi:hypothetical protein
MRRPRRYRLRLYVAAVRGLLNVLTRIDDWMLNRQYPHEATFPSSEMDAFTGLIDRRRQRSELCRDRLSECQNIRFAA